MGFPQRAPMSVRADFNQQINDLMPVIGNNCIRHIFVLLIDNWNVPRQTRVLQSDLTGVEPCRSKARFRSNQRCNEQDLTPEHR